jgi:hypothetical protein
LGRTAIRATVVPVALALVATFACAPDRIGAPATAAIPRLVVVEGDGTTAKPGDTIPVVVRLESGKGGAVPNRLVNWVVTKGGGSVWVPTTQTNAHGESRNYWIVGASGAEQALELRDVDASTGEMRVYGIVTAQVPQPTAAEISTLAGWDGGRQIGMFGAAPGGTAYGQSFTVPVNAPVLDQFTFWLNAGGGAQPNIVFSAYAMAWDGSKASGPVLWKSGALTGPTSVMQRYDIDVGALRLSPGAQYIAFLSTIEYLGSFPSNAQVLMGYGFNPYADGRFYALVNATDMARLTSAPWDTDAGGDFDAAFIARFSSP